MPMKYPAWNVLNTHPDVSIPSAFHIARNVSLHDGEHEQIAVARLPVLADARELRLVHRAPVRAHLLLADRERLRRERLAFPPSASRARAIVMPAYPEELAQDWRDVRIQHGERSLPLHSVRLHQRA